MRLFFRYSAANFLTFWPLTVAFGGNLFVIKQKRSYYWQSLSTFVFFLLFCSIFIQYSLLNQQVNCFPDMVLWWKCIRIGKTF